MEPCRLSSTPTTAGGPLPHGPGPTPPSLTPELALAIQQLTDALQSLSAVLQAQRGTDALGAPKPPGVVTGGGAPQQSPVQQSPLQSPTQQPRAATPAAQPGGPASFTVASFNTLGASHTAGGTQHPGWRSGAARTPGMVDELRQHAVDVAGLQEFQGSQRAAFASANTGYDMSTAGDNSIVWKSDTFRLVQKSSLKVPYFEGKETEMPVVQLEHKATGKRAWFVNIHNPADTADHHKQGAYRAEAVRREQAYVAKLRATGLPVYLVGDFNDRSTAAKSLTAGGAATASAPASARPEIDWIFGAGPVQFTGSQADHSPERAQVSDHPIVVATTQI
ncbi:MAG: Type phosphodiesterase / nucleotide pyrophosphatase [Thermoleophilia bacterium]|nr:Type phosphodiesterase / nucleotide pyrophosphatase [Thermoleophilia bacterium]